MSVGESVLAGFLKHELRGLVEFGSGRDAMKASEETQVFVRSGAGGFVPDSGPFTRGEKGFLGE